MRFSAVLCFATLISSGFGQLLPEERKGLEEALSVGNLTISDLNFARRQSENLVLSKFERLALDEPVSTLDQLLTLHKSAATSKTSNILKAAAQLLDVKFADSPGFVVDQAELPKEIPVEFHSIIRNLVKSLGESNALVRRAQEKLTPEELRSLIEGLPRLAINDRSYKFDFSTQNYPGDEALLKLVAKIDFEDLYAASILLASEAEQTLAELKSLSAKSTWQGFVKFKLSGQTVIFAGVGDDTHRDRDARLVIDIGGNDRYYGRHGAGVGYASLAIDLGGDDHYKLPDVGAGCGLLGVGFAFDLGGHDNFRGKSLAFGSGIGGVGIFYKDGGDDSYQSDTLTQGTGMFGVGILHDTRGNDLYSCKLLGQGAGRTQGLGWLIDNAGQDNYRAGGLMLHTPMFKNVHYSMSQGYGGGTSELQGGIGLLTDGSGDDAYIAETYAQGSGRQNGLGSLGDLEGRDTYRGHHFSQGSGEKSGSGYLIDLSEDDSYIVSVGASHGCGQDYGVGVLFDRSGNDVYAGRESRPGLGNANGLGLFIDVDGDDRYFGPPGVGNIARNSGSLGVFADLNGNDVYQAGLNDEEAAFRPSWGIAFDAEVRKTDGGVIVEPTKRLYPQVGSIPLVEGKLNDLWDAANHPDANTSRAAVDQFVGMGIPALRLIVDQKIGNLTSDSRAVLAEIASAMGSDGKLLVAMKIASPKEAEARNALIICSDLQATEAGPYVPAALKIPSLVRLATTAAGQTKSTDSVGDLLPLAANKDPWIARESMLSLALIGDPMASGTAQALLNSPDFLTRKAAIEYLSKLPEGLSAGRTFIGSSVERETRIGIEILGAIGTADALKLIGPKLLDERIGVRISALFALEGRAPAEFRQSILDRRRDPSPLVRSVAARIDPGR